MTVAVQKGGEMPRYKYFGGLNIITNDYTIIAKNSYKTWSRLNLADTKWSNELRIIVQRVSVAGIKCKTLEVMLALCCWLRIHQPQPSWLLVSSL